LARLQQRGTSRQQIILTWIGCLLVKVSNSDYTANNYTCLWSNRRIYSHWRITKPATKQVSRKTRMRTDCHQPKPMRFTHIYCHENKPSVQGKKYSLRSEISAGDDVVQTLY
jgi:hypothetical protein